MTYQALSLTLKIHQIRGIFSLITALFVQIHLRVQSKENNKTRYYWPTWGPFYWHVLNFCSTRIGNHMSSKIWGEITYPFPNCNGCTLEIWEWISNLISHYDWCNFLSMLELKLNHIGKKSPWHYVHRHYRTIFHISSAVIRNLVKSVPCYVTGNAKVKTRALCYRHCVYDVTLFCHIVRAGL